MAERTGRLAACTAFFAATLLAAPLTPGAAAQEVEIGMREYMQRCAACHGPRGAGDGPMAGLLKDVPPDLRLLAERNGGTFPVERVYQSIDGRLEIAAHGTRDMPLWGSYFSSNAIDRGVAPGPALDQIVMGRILSIVYYLQAIQKQ